MRRWGLSAHREAVDLYRRAQRTTPSETPVAQRADLLAALGTELAAVDDNAGAADALAEAYRLRRGIGADIDAAEVVPALATARHALGADIDERDELLRRILTKLGAARRTEIAAWAAAKVAPATLHQTVRLT